MKQPNLVFVFSDQHRMQSTGYAGDPNVHTPNMDRLVQQGINFPYAISNCPVCAPNRASLLTGQYPLTHHVIYNDVHLAEDSVTFAHAFKKAGYDTAYIGKWHLNGRGRNAYIPTEAHLGFDYWRVLECTHDYNRSAYYCDEDDNLILWEGYDAFAQTNCALDYIKAQHARPFALVLSWGPPHDPYHTAPEEYRKRFDGVEMKLRPNVPVWEVPYAQKHLPGYYAHIEALDDALGELMDAVDENTIFVYTSDHGDMLGSQGWGKKQKPWDENVRIPFILRAPELDPAVYSGIFNTPDVAPTLLGLCGVEIPKCMEGIDRSSVLRGSETAQEGEAYLINPSAFGEWARCYGGREWRGIRTIKYTYVRALDGPWLLYDNVSDPYQMNNLVGKASELQNELDSRLQSILDDHGDQFLHGEVYAAKYGYPLDDNLTVPIL